MHVPISHAKFHYSRNLLPEPHTPGAVYATGHLLHRNERPNVLLEYDSLCLVVTRLIPTVTDGQILQLTLTTLIANRAIEGMIDQQELHHAFLCCNRQIGMSENLHSRSHRRGASR